jgi:hypothetical protein
MFCVQHEAIRTRELEKERRSRDGGRSDAEISSAPRVRSPYVAQNKAYYSNKSVNSESVNSESP